jgi:hypothetical protein
MLSEAEACNTQMSHELLVAETMVIERSAMLAAEQQKLCMATADLDRANKQIEEKDGKVWIG